MDAAGIDPARPTGLCGEAAQALLALREPDGENYTDLDSAVDRGLLQLASRMQPEEAARLLSDALRRSPNASVRGDLAEGLAAVAVRMDPAQRATLCAAAAHELIEGVHRATDPNDPGHLARGLAAVVPQMKPDRQAPVYSEAADQIIAGMRSSTGMPEEERRDEALLAIATKMERRQRAQVCAEAARCITETDASQRRVEGYYDLGGPETYTISHLAAHMESDDAAALVAPVMHARLANRIARLHNGVKWSSVTEDGLVGLLKYCDAPTAADAAWRLAQPIAFTGDPIIGEYTSFVAVAPWNDLVSDPRSRTDNNDKSPRGCRLTTQQLVELLKMPTCFGTPRRLILDHLEERYGRRFDTVWSFVRFAEAERLGLDFTTPPIRPGSVRMDIPRQESQH
jgi:hypothetical protein